MEFPRVATPTQATATATARAIKKASLSHRSGNLKACNNSGQVQDQDQDAKTRTSKRGFNIQNAFEGTTR
jgi:hypothetical protein